MHKLIAWLKRKLRFRKLYFRIFSSIAFIPATLALLILALAFFVMYLDASGLSYALIDYIPFVITHNADTARSVLSTLATGMLSLMVFSFTMVMVVLTMISNNYTPRVLPGLINNKSHQTVLGLYLGSIAYTIVVLLNVESERYSFAVPELSVLISAVLVFICFVAFVYFIHNISQSIQIGNILETLFRKTRQKVYHETAKEYLELPDGAALWTTIQSPEAGYFQGFNVEAVLKVACRSNIQLIIEVEEGKFLFQNKPFLRYNKPISPNEIEEILSHADYYHQEHLQVNFLYGFKHITEIAIKALSPGINDPGTAIKAINYLTQLYIDLLPLGNYQCIRDQWGYPRLFFYQQPFEDIFYRAFADLRNYASSSVTVQLKLLEMLNELERAEGGEKYSALFVQERRSLLSNASTSLGNKEDPAQLWNKGQSK